MPDADLLYETLDAVIEADTGNRWIQGEWITPLARDGSITEVVSDWCGTAGCFAGHRAFLDGAVPIVAHGVVSRSRVLLPDGQITGVEVYAEDRLRLTNTQSLRLFAGSNSLEDLKQIVDQIVAGEIQ